MHSAPSHPLPPPLPEYHIYTEVEDDLDGRSANYLDIGLRQEPPARVAEIYLGDVKRDSSRRQIPHEGAAHKPYHGPW